MILIGDSCNKDLSEKLAEHIHAVVHYPDIRVFPDSEKRVRINQDITGHDVLILKSFQTPVDSSVIEFCFLVDAAKRAGATSVYGVTPYLAYQRADHVFRGGEAVPLEAIIKMIETSGLDKILVAEPHSIKIPELFIIPVADITAMPLFADKVREIQSDLSNVSVVSPDMGGIRRIKILSELLDDCSWATINKDRDLETGSIVATRHEGEIRDVCFIVDDMIATGGTVVEAVSYLIENGAKTVYIMATHPVFAGDAVIKLQSSNVQKVFVTDSLGIPDEKRFEKLEILSLAQLIAHNLKEENVQ